MLRQARLIPKELWWRIVLLQEDHEPAPVRAISPATGVFRLLNRLRRQVIGEVFRFARFLQAICQVRTLKVDIRINLVSQLSGANVLFKSNVMGCCAHPDNFVVPRKWSLPYPEVVP